MEPLLIGIDSGTTSTKAILFDTAGRVLAEFSKGYEFVDSGPGHIEQNAEDWWRAAADGDTYLQRHVRKQKLGRWWREYSYALDLIGLVVAVLLIYIVGATLGSIIGRRLYARGEQLISKVPLIKQVYPSVKQVTEFLVGPSDEAEKMRFSRVVAVEYPRKGLWSVGLVTGSTMRMIQERAGTPSLTVFIPSSPTPFTGYVITVPKEDTIDLPVTIEEALRFSVSAGVIVPPSQLTKTYEDAALTSASQSIGREPA